MASMLMHLQVDDYDAWKSMFDSDPAGRKQAATGHSIARSVDDPNAVFIRADFASVDEAKTFRERLMESGALDRSDISIKVQPTVVEEAEATSY